MKLRLSQILYLILVIPIALSPLFPITANASTAGGLTTDPLLVIPDSVDEFNLATSTTTQLAGPVEPDSWPMAAANPERTSWTPEEVRGQLSPEWYKPFEPYISKKVQIIAAYGMLYISTANGLYALDADTGAETWVYPTELPLGHSPTIHNGVAYVGGFDHKLHAVDAMTGQGLWTFEAEKGFQTNPLIIDGIVFAGNRDGYMYAIGAHGQPNQGRLEWKFKTDGPILYSAAYNDGVVYFASNDSYAYALNAQNGSLVWTSAKLPGAGFHSWWPVVYQNVVIFSGSWNYRNRNEMPGGIGLVQEVSDIFPNRASDPRGTLIGPLGAEPGDWATGTATIDTSRPTVTSNGSTTPITEYLEEKPWRRTYFVLDRSTGQENMYDFDNDGWKEYAPILWFGTRNGNRYPPLVGANGVLYQMNTYMSDAWIPGGQITGWKIDTPFISLTTSDWGAHDEPHAYSGGGDIIYWNLCCDREAGAIDVSIPYTNFPSMNTSREWRYFTYNLHALIPGYNIMTSTSDETSTSAFSSVYGGRNGVYGWHGDVNPPIPYQGRVYMHRSNAIIAFSPSSGAPVALPMQTIVPAQFDNSPTISSSSITDELIFEIQKIVNAGHLRSGWFNFGGFDWALSQDCRDNLTDLFHQPAETIYTLIQALPYLPADLQLQLRSYIQQEFQDFPPHDYEHIGWDIGASREAFDLPPEVAQAMGSYPARSTVNNFIWQVNPFAFYAIWRYAEEFGEARNLFDTATSKSSLMQSFNNVPSNSDLSRLPYVHNAYIAGYIGFLELERLAGYPESTGVRSELDRLLQLRATSFSKDIPDNIYSARNNTGYCRALSVSSNFLFLVPELAEYLNNHALNAVQSAVDEYEYVAPYWFAAKPEEAFGETTIHHSFDAYTLLQAKARILNQPFEELARYIDVPSFAVGDLYHIQNLVTVLEADTTMPNTPDPQISPSGGIFDQPVLVTISSAPGATTHFSLDGSTPTVSAPVYETPFLINQSVTLKAKSFLDGHDPSATISADFLIQTTFDDVPHTHWAHDIIEELYQSGYVVGCSTSPMLYCPDQILDRAESAVFVLRGFHGAIVDPPYPPPATPTFSDVDPSYWGYGWIESMWQDGFTAGCSSDPLAYCPNQEHTRAEGSVFFLRIRYGPDFQPPDPSGIFNDVNINDWYAGWVEAAYADGILPVCNDDPLEFCPDAPLDRAWAASMMIQAQGG